MSERQVFIRHVKVSPAASNSKTQEQDLPLYSGETLLGVVNEGDNWLGMVIVYSPRQAFRHGFDGEPSPRGNGGRGGR